MIIVVRSYIYDKLWFIVVPINFLILNLMVRSNEEQVTKNKEQRTKNKEQRTKNKEQRTTQILRFLFGITI